MVEAETVTSVYDFVSSWLTPSCLFIFINLFIVTIAITTRFANPRKARVDSNQLPHSSSLLHRLMSFNLSCYKNQPSPPLTLDETETETQNMVSQKHERIKEKLNRAPSLLERVLSVKFFRSQSIEAEMIEPEPEPDIGGDESEGVDEKADNFIKRFKEQLRLQRLDSILRYRDMKKRDMRCKRNLKPFGIFSVLIDRSISKLV